MWQKLEKVGRYDKNNRKKGCDKRQKKSRRITENKKGCDKNRRRVVGWEREKNYRKDVKKQKKIRRMTERRKR